MSKRRLTSLAALLALAMFAAACSDSTNDAETTDTTAAAAPTEPIRIGYVLNDQTELGNPPEEVVTAQKEMEALVAWANQTGGVGGRQIEATGYKLGVLWEPEQLIAECTKMAEDDQIEVLLDESNFNWDNTLQCLADHEIASVVLAAATDRDFLQELSPFVTGLYPTIDRQMTAMVTLLDEHGILDEVDTVGIALIDEPVVHKNFDEVLAPALERAGVTDYETQYIAYGDQAAVNNSVLKFKSAGVDLALMFVAYDEYNFFVAQAKTQNYFPRYVYPDFQAMVQIGVLFGPSDQNKDAIAVSTFYGPAGIAKDASRSPTDGTSPFKPGQITEGYEECLAIYTEQLGVDYMNPGESGASGSQNQYCDAFMLWLKSAREVGASWTADRFAEGLSKLGPHKSSRMYHADYSPGTTGGPDQFGFGVYSQDCQCFVQEGEWTTIE